MTSNFRYFLIRKLVYELAKKKCYDARIRSCTCLGKHHRTASCSFVLFDSYACSVHECLICEVKWNLIILKTGIQFHITFASTLYDVCINFHIIWKSLLTWICNNWFIIFTYFYVWHHMGINSFKTYLRNFENVEIINQSLVIWFRSGMQYTEDRHIA